jgi:ornithine cyclodeaminase/alanine dehydrogenase-like protein (mu-crystallin family)
MNNEMLYLSKKDVELLNIPMKEVIAALEKMFKEKGEGRVEMPPKPGIHTRPDAFIHAMPAYLPAMQSAGIKWVGGYPENHRKGLPYITGLLVLNDPETGLPLSVMDCTWITAARTGAATAVAVKHLALQGSHTVAILGCGVQGESNLAALHEVLLIKLLKIYDIDMEKADRYRRTVEEVYNIPVQVGNGPEDTVREAQVIVTAGPFLKNARPCIEHSWIAKGAFCCPLDLDSYFKPEVFNRSDVLCTDDFNQFVHFREEGYFSGMSRDDVLDLGEVVSGKMTVRRDEEQIVTSINIGIALEDMAVAPLVYREAKKQEKGTWLEL